MRDVKIGRAKSIVVNRLWSLILDLRNAISLNPPLSPTHIAHDNNSRIVVYNECHENALVISIKDGDGVRASHSHLAFVPLTAKGHSSLFCLIRDS